MKLTKDIIGLSPLFFIGVLLVFNRPFVGISLFGLRIGELIIGGGLLVSLIVFAIFIGARKYLNFFESYSSKLSFTLIIGTFLLSIFVIYDTDIFSIYTYKISSYLWTTGYIFVGAYLLNNQDLLRKYKTVILPLFLFVPIAHYILSTGYYPNFIIDIFIKYSDKFQFTKASDIMLSLLVANVLNYKLTISKYFKFSYMLFSVSLLSPLLLLMSRGAFISTVAFAIISLYYFRHYIFGHIKKAVYMFIFSFFVLILSVYNVNGVDYSFNVNFGGYVVSDEELSLSSNLERIVKKDEQRKAFLSLYFENGRLVSHDNTTNWRLDIWQDVVEDMNKKNLIMKGYGYNEILPVMTDPSAPGRLGRDGLNEHVHNYFVNILARGGFLQLFLFITFYIYLIKYYKFRHGNYKILSLLLPVFILSSLDVTMEGVHFPFIFFSYLGYSLREGI